MSRPRKVRRSEPLDVEALQKLWREATDDSDRSQVLTRLTGWLKRNWQPGDAHDPVTHWEDWAMGIPFPLCAELFRDLPDKVQDNMHGEPWKQLRKFWGDCALFETPGSADTAEGRRMVARVVDLFHRYRDNPLLRCLLLKSMCQDWDTDSVLLVQVLNQIEPWLDSVALQVLLDHACVDDCFKWDQLPPDTSDRVVNVLVRAGIRCVDDDVAIRTMVRHAVDPLTIPGANSTLVDLAFTFKALYSPQ